MSGDTVEWLRSQADRKRLEAARCDELATGLDSRQGRFHGPWKPQQHLANGRSASDRLEAIRKRLDDFGPLDEIRDTPEGRGEAAAIRTQLEATEKDVDFTAKVVTWMVESGRYEGSHYVAGESIDVFTLTEMPVPRWGTAVLVQHGDEKTLVVHRPEWDYMPAMALDWADHFLTDGW